MNKNNDVLLKVEEMINYIENTNDYKNYLLIKEKMSNDIEINNLLDEIKHLQKRLANNYNVKIKEELEEKNKVLENIPLYREYLNTLDEINNTFNIVENSLNKYFMDKVN